jgi:hypothetical protein
MTMAKKNLFRVDRKGSALLISFETGWISISAEHAKAHPSDVVDSARLYVKGLLKDIDARGLDAVKRAMEAGG